MIEPEMLAAAPPATAVAASAPDASGIDSAPTDEHWLTGLREHGAAHDDAVRRLHALVLKAARQQISRMPHLWVELGTVRAEEIIQSAADEATVAVLAHLDQFEARSRFSTWVYKFGVYHAATEARRALWRDRAMVLDDYDEPAADQPITPESYAQARDLSSALSLAIHTVLTAHQRRVALALLIDEVPIDVLAERLGTSRNNLYKTLHDARVRLREALLRSGHLPGASTIEVTP